MKHVSLAIACVLAFFIAPAAQATLSYYSVSLSGLAESPANDSAGTGTGLITLDTVLGVLSTMRVQVTFSGLTGTTTASHIHCCTTVAGTGTAGVATTTPNFTDFPLGVTSGSYDHTFDMTLAGSYNPAFVTANGGSVAAADAAFLSGIIAGKTYLNIHTNYKTAGEIRGFLVPSVPEPSTLSLLGLGLLSIVFARRRRAH